ncbi:hypothetical protein EJ02DRAFT_468466 [Clathrospora elynae]|uniref:WW domain-containing protein n=1 Tax=Clathrospora elynae TaxID=706981 RepID=A0A6A5SHZ5_9PLEO|nr:hypothetical protein EJ02DRAFT_468466 [Clathrospora elynae]
MDFLKKKMKELLDDDDKKDKPKDSQASTSQDSHGGAGPGDRALSNSYYGQSGQGGPPQHQQGYPPQGVPQGQGYPPQGQGYPQQQPYGQGASTPVGPPAPYGAPPPMPPGWTQQWDQNSQRWFYIEQATGRTQWDPPAHLPPGPYAPPPAGAPYVAPGGHDERGLFGNTQGHQGHDYTPSGQKTNEAEKKKDKGHSTAMLAAAGVGGIAAGAWIGHELTEDDNKQSSHAPPAAAAAPAAAAYGAPAAAPYGAPPPADPYAFQEPPPVPTHDADGNSISSSDRSSMESRREELIEAQQEYQEELEESYGSD